LEANLNLSFDQKTDELRFSISHVIGNGRLIYRFVEYFPAVDLHPRKKRKTVWHEGPAQIKNQDTNHPFKI